MPTFSTIELLSKNAYGFPDNDFGHRHLCTQYNGNSRPLLQDTHHKTLFLDDIVIYTKQERGVYKIFK